MTEAPVPALSYPAEHLTDGVVTLRPWSDGDAAARSSAFSDAEIVRWTDLPETYGVDDAADDIRRSRELHDEGDRLSFAVTDAAGTLIGGIDLMLGVYERAELGYVIAASARRRGHATRAVRLLTDWSLLQEDIERIELPVPVGNIPSAGVARRAGFTAEGTLREYLALRDGGPRHDVTMYAFLAPRPT